MRFGPGLGSRAQQRECFARDADAAPSVAFHPLGDLGDRGVRPPGVSRVELRRVMDEVIAAGDKVVEREHTGEGEPSARRVRQTDAVALHDEIDGGGPMPRDPCVPRGTLRVDEVHDRGSVVGQRAAPELRRGGPAEVPVLAEQRHREFPRGEVTASERPDAVMRSVEIGCAQTRPRDPEPACRSDAEGRALQR